MDMDVMRRRKMPDLVLESPSFSIQGFLGMIYIVFSILLGLFFLLGGFIGKNIFVTLFGLILTALVIWGTAAAIKEIRNDLVKRKKKRQWIRNAVSAQAVIADRKQEYDPYGESIEQAYLHDLALRLPSSAIENPQEQVVWARVSMGIYDKYKQRDIAHIFYSKTDPYLFLIEGE
jgi:hypothetical protein